MTDQSYTWLVVDRDPEEGSFVPALDAVQTHRRQLRDGLMEGLDHPRDVLLWQHAVAAGSLGQANTNWMESIYQNRWLLSAMLKPEVRGQVSNQPPDEERAHNVRLDVYLDDVLPAFKRARSMLRKRAGDYSDQGAVEDTEKQQFVAMRPRLHQRAVTQHRTLRRALGLTENPITDREAVVDWCSDVVDATNSFVDDGFFERVTARVGNWYPALISEETGVWLQTQLADEVLPAMNRALEDAAERSNELASTPAVRSEVPQG